MTAPGAPIVGWDRPDEAPGYGIGDIARGGWTLTVAELGRLAAIAAVPMAILLVCYLPFFVSFATTFDNMLAFWSDLDFTRYYGDPEGLQRDMMAAMQPATDQSVMVAVGTAVAVLVSIIGFAALSAATLDVDARRRPSIGNAYRIALGRPAVILPALVLGGGYALILVPLSFAQPGLMYGGTIGLDPLAGALSSLGIFALYLVVLYLAVRWALYFQVAIAEGTGVRRSLSRAAELTAGIRVRLGLAFFVLALLLGLLVSFIAFLPAVVVGYTAGSIGAAFITASITWAVTGLVYLPFFAAALTYVYVRRVRERPGSADPGAADPAAGDAASA